MPFRRKPAPKYDPQPTGVLRTWTPQALPQGEIPPAETLALLAAAARPQRDVWSGTRDTDRRA